MEITRKKPKIHKVENSSDQILENKEALKSGQRSILEAITPLEEGRKSSQGTQDRKTSKEQLANPKKITKMVKQDNSANEIKKEKKISITLSLQPKWFSRKNLQALSTTNSKQLNQRKNILVKIINFQHLKLNQFSRKNLQIRLKCKLRK